MKRRKGWGYHAGKVLGVLIVAACALALSAVIVGLAAAVAEAIRSLT